MRSTDKLMEAVDQLADADDDAIAEALPGVPPPVVRAALPLVIDAMPQDPDELDQFLTQVGNFCHALRSDVEQPA